MACNGFNPELYDLYALGVLKRDEKLEIDNHLLSSCDTCEHEVRLSLQRASLFSLVVPSAAPPRSLRNRIVESVRPAKRGVWAGLAASSRVWAAALALVTLAVSVSWFWVARSGSLANPVVVTRIIPPVILETPPRPVSSHSAAPPPAASSATGGKSAGREIMRPLPSAQPEVQTLAETVARQRIEIAQLGTELRNKDVQLASSQQRFSETQARATATQNDGARVEQLETQVAADRRQVDELTRQVRFYQAAIESQRAQLGRNVQLISLLSAPDLRLFHLRATEQGGAASGKALLAGNSQVIFYASNLPTLPSGRTYQLWLMRRRGRAVVSGGVFDPDQNQRAMLDVKSTDPVADITALAVTEEPAGGRTLPTGHKILIGSAST